jgi:hypothetical protein
MPAFSSTTSASNSKSARSPPPAASPGRRNDPRSSRCASPVLRSWSPSPPCLSPHRRADRRAGAGAATTDSTSSRRVTRTWLRAAKLRSASNSAPAARTTCVRAAAACAAAASSSTVLPTPASPTVGAHRPGQPTRQRTSEGTRPSGPFRSAALPSPIGEDHHRPQWDLPTTPNSPTLRQCLAWLDLRGLSVLSMGQIPGPPRPKAGARRAEAGRRLRAAGGTGRGNSDGGVGDRVGRARQMITRNRGYVRRARRRSFQLSFHQVLLGPTGAHWLDDPPDLSCKASTRQHTVDDPRLSCNRLLGRIPGICTTRTRRGSLVPP